MSKPENTVLVHKEGEEGVLTLNKLTGQVNTPHDERPDWSEGLATAMLQERVDFYQKRLGDGTAFQDIANAAAIEYSDLSWIGVDAEGDEIEIEASNDFRMDLIANCLGMNREDGELSGDILAEHEVSRENRGRSAEEMQALEQSVKDGFSGEGQQQQDRRAEQG